MKYNLDDGTWPDMDRLNNERIEKLERENAELLAAAKEYMAACPADYDTTKSFKAASDRLSAAIAKAESK